MSLARGRACQFWSILANCDGLLLFFSARLRYLPSKPPFYRSLLQEFPVSTSVPFVFITPEAPDVAERFPGMLGVRSTPTLILADSNAAVRGYRVGQLTPEREAEIHKGLGK